MNSSTKNLRKLINQQCEVILNDCELISEEAINELNLIIEKHKNIHLNGNGTTEWYNQFLKIYKEKDKYLFRLSIEKLNSIPMENIFKEDLRVWAEKYI